MIKDAYEKLRKKLKVLPDYDIINNEFEIVLIEKEDFLINSIVEKIRDNIEHTIEIIDKIMQPEHVSLVELYEYHCFTNNDKKDVLETFKKIMFFYRNLMYTEMLKDDNESAKIIAEITKEWPLIRKEVAPYIKKLEKCWKEPKEPEEILEYLG